MEIRAKAIDAKFAPGYKILELDGEPCDVFKPEVAEHICRLINVEKTIGEMCEDKCGGTIDFTNGYYAGYRNCIRELQRRPGGEK